MIIIYSKHAEKRIDERGISRTMIEDVLGNPDIVENQSDQKKAAKIVNGKAIVVMYRETDSFKFIITAFSSSRTRKYVRKPGP